MAIIGVLIAGIFLTNALYTDSGLNVFMRSIFSTNTASTIEDERSYGEFTPVLSTDEGVNVAVSDGVMTFSGQGSVYVPCDGKITSLIQDENGKYTVEITHSKNFKSILSGLDYAYADVLDDVYYNVPVGFIKNNVTMCFYGGNNQMIYDYQIVDNAIVWAV